ncbi:hypothetical protein EDB81DRAFT_765800 [Dactylonectria macrodidyma]|uniref:Rhodopsin domain-containing protein n=1 Tax=Dactylonectria macrodidyma TaxID=307937 RepID=A0A9P9IL57_9HYPO|nr:hypothetical protein EDB81DRAFT_765800 [Dactylonectria macrodidyma]
MAAQNRRPVMLVIIYLFTILASLFVAGRLFSRCRKLGRLTIDDYIILLSLALAILYVGFMTAAVSAGLGRHAATLSVPDLERAMFLTMVGMFPGGPSHAVPKFAVVSLLTKILSPSPSHVRLLWGAGNHQPAAHTSGLCGILHALRHDRGAVDSFSALLDFYFAIYPAIVLWPMRMNLRKKLALSVALGFGICAGTVALYKCITIPRIANRDDFTYVTGNLFMWTSIETNSVIIAACIPMLLPLVELCFGKRFLSDRPAPVILSGRWDQRSGDRRPNIDQGTTSQAEQQAAKYERQSLETIIIREGLKVTARCCHRPPIRYMEGKFRPSICIILSNRQQKPSVMVSTGTGIARGGM